MKVDQLKYLMAENKLDSMIIIKFILKLCSKFIVNNKFNEIEKLIYQEKNFQDQLTLSKIFKPQIVNEFALHNFNNDNHINFVNFMENLEDDFNERYDMTDDQLGVGFIIVLFKFALENYFGYKILIQNIENNNLPIDRLNTKLEVL
jgi:hypothetical protein